MSQPPWPNTEKTDMPQESQECPCGHWAPHGPHEEPRLADWEKALLFDEPHQNNPGLPEHLEDLHFMVGRLSREREELAEKLDTELRRTQRLQDVVHFSAEHVELLGKWLLEQAELMRNGGKR